MNRTTIIRGPAQITYAGDTYYSQGDIKLNLGHETFPIVNSAFGTVQYRSKQRTATISFTPVGNLLPVAGVNGSYTLWNYGDKKAGDRLLGNSDVPLVIWTYGGVKYTFHNVALTKIPELMLSATKTVAGEATFTALGKIDVDPDNAESLMTLDTNAGPPTDAFDPDTVITEFYEGAYGSTAPWNELHTTNGWSLSFDLSLNPVTTDELGIIDWTVGDVRATARAQVLGITEANVISLGSLTGDPNKLIYMHVKRGSKLPDSNDLVITGTHLRATLNSAQVRMVPTQFGTATLRFADLEWNATRKVAGGVLEDVFKVEKI